MLVRAVRRIGFGEYNASNFLFAETAVDVVEAMRIQAFVLDCRMPLENWPGAINKAYDYAHMNHRPIRMFLDLKE